MPLLPAICTQCGAKLEVDSTKEAAICEHCGTPFIVEKAINKYNTTVITDNVTVIGQESADVLADTIQKFIDAGDYRTASEFHDKMQKSYSTDYRVYMYEILIRTKNFWEDDNALRNVYNHFYMIRNCYNKMKVLCTNSEDDFYKKYDNYVNHMNKIIEQDNRERQRKESIIRMQEARSHEKKVIIGVFIFAIIYYIIQFMF